MHPQGEIKVETSYGIHPILNIAGMPSWYLITIIPSFFFPRAENCLFLLPPSITFLTYLCVRWQRWFLYSAGLFPGKGIRMVVLSSVVSQRLEQYPIWFSLFQGSKSSKRINPKTPNCKNFSCSLSKSSSLETPPCAAGSENVTACTWCYLTTESNFSQLLKYLPTVFKHKLLCHNLKPHKVSLTVVFSINFESVGGTVGNLTFILVKYFYPVFLNSKKNDGKIILVR